jgi:CMP-N-acetylneuraminic acid synthetase/2-polyprenyl-3-methyl-5-hydroxy-6-metoxy-1,4-benzoquinol methylase
MNVLAVIPARGGSKGIPSKNLAMAAGRPLLAYTADTARAARRLTRIIVSTDDESIADSARSLGLEVPFIRPAPLAGDEAPMLPVLQHAVKTMRESGFAADVVVLLQPTSPLRRAEHIDGAVELLERTGADSVVSVVEVPHQFNPVSVLSLDGDRLKPFIDGPLVTRRQDKPRVFARNGPAVVAVRASVLDGGSLYGTDTRALVMNSDESLDIDSPSDLAQFASSMRIPYRHASEYQPVDIAKLRPGGSYKSLIEKRTHPIDDLVARFGRIPDELLTSRPCPTCGATDAVLELEKDHMRIVRCRSCDLVYVNPTFDETHYKSVYASQAYQDIVRDLGINSHEYRVARFGTERVGMMSQFVRVPPGRAPRFLDVGCSTGFVVEAAKHAGWEASGIDLNPSAIEYGRSRGLDLRTVALESTGFAPGSFDAVGLFDVVEHLLDPGGTVRAAVNLLAPGGILFLYVPNYDSASRMLMGANAHFIWPTHHLNYYTPSTIRDFLRRHQLMPELIVTEGLDLQDYLWYRREVLNRHDEGLEEIADLLQFFVNAGCYGKNLRVIARRGA